MPLHGRNDTHIARRIWHFCGVFIAAVLYYFLSRKTALIVAFSVSGVLILIDALRLQIPRLNQTALWALKPFMRESERHRISGLSYMLLGTLLIIVFFPRHVVLLTLLFFSLADPLASYFGVRFGKDKLIGEKSLQGSFAAFAACFVVAFLFFWAMDMVAERRFIVCMLAGLIGAFAELIPIGKLDDNFTFPLVNATLLTGLFYIFGGL